MCYVRRGSINYNKFTHIFISFDGLSFHKLAIIIVLWR